MKIRKLPHLLLFMLLLGASISRAQKVPGTFTLAEAQQYAMKNSWILRNTNLDIHKAEKKVWETITTGLPQVSATASYNNFLNLPVSLIPGEFFGGEAGTYIPVKFGQDYNSDFGFTASQMIFDGSYIVGVGSSKIYLSLARQAHEKTEIDIRNAVSQAYYLVLIGQENLKVMEENLRNTKRLLTETQAYYDNGFREEQDVDQMQLLVKNAENELLKASREIKVAKVVLKYSMGCDLDEEIELSDSLALFVDPLISSPQLPRFDLSAHIDYRLSETQYLAAGKLLNLEKSGFLPRINAFYSYTKTSYGNKANLFRSSQDWYPSSLVGLTVSLPIFASGQRMSKVQQARMDLEKASNQRELASQTVQKDYLTALANLETAVGKFENDKSNRELSVRILEKAKIKFNNGISSSTELAQLETQYLQSYGAYIGSLLQLLQADLELKKATGQL